MIPKFRSIRYAWLISYASILLIPTIISLIVYVMSSHVLETEVNKANNTLLKQVQIAIDGRLMEIEKLALDISINPRVKGLAYINDKMDQMQQFNLIMQDLRVYKTSNLFLDNIYLYMNNSDDALTYNTYVPSDVLIDRLERYQGTTEEQWKEILGSKHVNQFLPIIGNGGDTEVSTQIAYVKSLFSDNRNTPFINLVIIIDSSKLLESIRNIQWLQGSEILVTDENKQVLTTTSTLPMLKYEDLEINNGKFTISDTKSTITNWEYIFAVPTKVIHERLNYTRNITIVGLLISIGLGCLLTYFFLKRNYNPVNNLMNAIAKHNGLPTEQKRNEYELIHSAFSHTLIEREQIKSLLDKQNKVLKSNELVRWLKGKAQDINALQHVFAEYMTVKSDTYLVLLFYIEEKGAFFDSDTELYKMQARGKIKLAQLIVSNVVEELARQHNEAFTVEIDDTIVCIMNFEDTDSTRNKREISRIANEARAFIGSKYKLSFMASASEFTTSFESVPMAYTEALDMMQYNMILGIDELTFYDERHSDTMNASGMDYYYPFRIEQHLINFIKVGDSERVNELLNEIFEVNFQKVPLSVSAAKLLMLNLISTMTRTLYDIRIFCDDDFLEELNPMHRLLSCQQISDVKAHMQDILNQVCVYITTKYRSEDNKLKDAVHSFIAQHYGDINLNISMIGQQLELSPSYLSRLYKEQSGEGLLDYLNRYRIEIGKRLLTEEQLTISEIAVRIGFVNSNTFIRTFKKIEGITPGQYKKVN